MYCNPNIAKQKILNSTQKKEGPAGVSPNLLTPQIGSYYRVVVMHFMRLEASMTCRQDMVDRGLEMIHPLLPNRPRAVARVDYGFMVSGIFHVLRTGAPLRDLPVPFSPWTTVCNRYNRRVNAGVWIRIFAALARISLGLLLLIDTSTVLANQYAAKKNLYQDPRGRRRARPDCPAAAHPRTGLVQGQRQLPRHRHCRNFCFLVRAPGPRCRIQIAIPARRPSGCFLP